MTDTAPPRKMTGQEVANSLTGFEELAIKQQFGASLDALDPITVARACGFTVLARERVGQPPSEAYMAVMQMPQSELTTLFATDDEDDADDRDPFAQSAAGKDSPPSATPTTSSPPSAS